MNEIGPRFVLVPVKIFEGSFGGAVIWENPGEIPCRMLHSNLYLKTFLEQISSPLWLSLRMQKSLKQLDTQEGRMRKTIERRGKYTCTRRNKQISRKAGDLHSLNGMSLPEIHIFKMLYIMLMHICKA